MKNVMAFCCALLTAAAMQAQIIHVPGDYPTIQQGIVAANNGDTVLVDDGVYYEQINFLGKKPLTVTSRFLTDGDTAHITNTIIDGSQITSTDTGSIVSLKSGEDTTSVLCGFTITNGTKGTRFVADGSVLRGGGGIFLSGSGARIIYNHITGNTLNTNAGGGQIIFGAGIGNQWQIDPSWVVIDHNTIENNSCYSASEQAGGSGITINCNSRITNNTITGNLASCTGTAMPFGGGFFAGGDPVWTSELVAYVMNNVIKNNTVTGQNSLPSGAGGMLQAITGVFVNNIVENNTALSNLFFGVGGGIYILGPRTGTVLANSTFQENISQGNGGAMYISSFSGNYNPDTAVVENNYFLNNSAKNGGAIQLDGNNGLFQNNVFNGNHASTWGGALSIINAVTGNVSHLAFLSNNTFSMNSADGKGGAIFSFKGKPIVTNSIFWADSSGVSNGPEIGVSTSDDLIFGIPGTGDTLEIAYSDINTAKINGGPFKNGGGNIDQDPLFIVADSLIPDHLNSPCVDAGIEEYLTSDGLIIISPDYDILGVGRPWGPYDMGAYEQSKTVGIGELTNPGLHVLNYPNPFSGLTTFIFTLPEPGNVTLKILDIFGRVVDEPVNGYKQKGEQKESWHAGNLPTGIYFYRIEAEGMVGTGKVIKQ